MTSIRYTLVALISAAALASCAGNDNDDYTDKSIVPAASEKAAAQNTAPATAAPGQIALPANTVPGTTMPVNLSQQPQSISINPQNNQAISAPQMATQTAVQTPTAPGMNPPHGQPNHRCDIAVGAPLNSKPAAATANPTTVTAQPQVTMKEIPNTQTTAPGMNPPHGQPGHRCDIAVGAPLNSKPEPAPTTTATPVAAPPPLLTPSKPDSSKN